MLIDQYFGFDLICENHNVTPGKNYEGIFLRKEVPRHINHRQDRVRVGKKNSRRQMSAVMVIGIYV